MNIVLKILLAVMLASTLVLAPVQGGCIAAQPPAETPEAQGLSAGQEPDREARENIAEAFLNERLTYMIGFWIFDHIAVGRVVLEETVDGGYTATLAAETTGFVGWLLKYRKDRYVSHLRLSEDGQRFITKTFEKTVNLSGKVRHSRTELDYDKRIMKWRSWGGGKEEKTGELPIPPDMYADDPLAAFYNFRYGVYGPVEEGREYKIPTFPKEDHVPEIYLRIATKDELDKRMPERGSYADYLADVRIDKELFGQKQGDIEIVFTGAMKPVTAVAKDVALFGDITGVLEEYASRIKLNRAAASDTMD